MKTVLGWLTALALGASIPVSVAHNIAASQPARITAHARPALGGVPGNFVYACTTATTAQCQYEEVFATYDDQGDPLLTVSPYGDIKSFGLAYSITPLGDVFHMRMSMGWETPNTYQSQLNFGAGCTAPHWWIGPNDSGSALQVWHCVNGAWTLYKTL